MAESLLIVEDDDGIAVPLARTLAREGYEVTRAPDGGTALEASRREAFDLVVLDLGLPDMDGLDVCRQLRGQGFSAPILILTARGGELDLVVGLDAGADDYLAKPFGLAELLARTRALLRRAASSVGAGDAPADGADPGGDGSGAGSVEPADARLRIDDAAHRVWVGDDEIHLSAKEYGVLWMMARSPGTVVTREQFMDEVWDEHWFGSTKTLDVTVGRLRQKLDDAGAAAVVVAIRGVGFRLDHADA